MNSYRPILGAALALALGFAATHRAQAEDLDLFVGAAATAQNPNVLVIIDNSANWSSASQQWDGGFKQGQSELRALRTVAGELTDKVNFGLMMFTEGSGSNAAGGYVRYHIRPMTDVNKTAFQEMIGPDTGCVDKANSLNGTPNCIYKNFDSPSEKTGTSKTNYSSTLFEAFKYLGGHTSPARAHLPNPNGSTPVDTVAGPLATHFGPVRYSGDPDVKTDKAAFSDPFTTYGSPITDDTSCGKNYIIFIGNGFPTQDLAGSVLTGVGGSATQLSMPVLSTINVTETLKDDLGNVITSCGTGGNVTNRLSNCTASIPQTLKDTFAHHTNFSCVETTPIAGGTISLACPGGSTRQYNVQATRPNVVSQTGESAVPAASVARNADEWAQFLYTTDVNAAEGQQNAKIYTIDVFKNAQDARQTSLLFNMARVGGGGYFQATNEQDIINAIRQILIDIQALNSVFASASLPINATNRSQNENQVFIGMFRPDADAKPRWYGNLKRYQIALFGEEAKLADAKGADAVSTETGFIRPCVESFWTSDSGKYWAFSQDSAGLCVSASTSVFSDLPDGSNVEKGATAEVVRKGNNPPTTDTTPTNTVNRIIYTCSKTSACKFGETMDEFNATNVSEGALGAADAAAHATLVDWIRGVDVDDENKNDDFKDVRPSVHGDVAHSRPLPVNYGKLPASDGGDTGVVMYYGANDGHFRAVRGRDGKELWSFIAPEHHAKLKRMKDPQEPLVLYPNMEEPLPTPTPTRKDYFFDGSAGLFQNLDNSKVWVFPSMRRGGRMIYGFDVTNPELPTMKWRVGCPNLLDDTDCTSGFEAMGQTWSVPSVALVKGYSDTSPVIITGGGYDRCEDNDFSDPTDASNTSLDPVCKDQKGATAFVIDADTGNLLQTFTGVKRSVVGDVTLVARTAEGFADHGYFADTGGGLYRIDFVDPATQAPLKAGDWVLTHIAQADPKTFRKFLFAPAAVFNAGRVFLTVGSGDRERPLSVNYPFREKVQNRFYMFLDTFATTGLPVNIDDATLMDDFTTATDCKTKMSAGSNGWFMDLTAAQGEQTVTSSTIFGGLVFFSTNHPDTADKGVCVSNLGTARGYALNLLNASGAANTTSLCGGARSAEFAGGGLPPSPVTGTVPVGPNGTPVTVMIGGVQRGGGVSTPIGASRVTPTITQRRSRIYWYMEGDK